ncbi:hypothetical protein LINPERHAP1_LOCUS6914 [Linum perenne]
MNTKGFVCDGRAGRFICSSPIVVEARALLEAVSFAASSHLSCTIFSDCLNLVSSIKANKRRWPWECYGLLGSISSLLLSSPTTTVRFVPRRDNLYADWVARAARTSSLPPDWVNKILFTSSPPEGGL